MNAKAAFEHPVTVEWGTPQDFFDELDAEFGFTLDVAATAENAKCPKYFTATDDGISKSWAEETCWMNPPYGRAIGAWMRKALKESRAGATVVCLVPARTDTRWWWETAIHGQVRFIKGRLSFTGGSSTNPQSHNAPFPVAVVVFSPHHEAAAIWSRGPTISQVECNDDQLTLADLVDILDSRYDRPTAEETR